MWDISTMYTTYNPQTLEDVKTKTKQEEDTRNSEEKEKFHLSTQLANTTSKSDSSGWMIVDQILTASN